MAAAAEMGEIEEMHSKEEGEPILNGDISEIENGNEDSQSSLKRSQASVESESMDVDEPNESPENVAEEGDEDADMMEEKSEAGDEEKSEDNSEPEDQDQDEDQDAGAEEKEEDLLEEKEEELAEEKDEEDKESVKSRDEISDSDSKTEDKTAENGSKSVELEEVVHEIIDDDDEMTEENMKNGLDKDEPIELNDSGEGEGDGDVMIIEEPKENGSIDKRRTSDELEVIELDSTPVKKKSELKVLPPRRSVRNMNKTKTYAESDKEEQQSVGTHSSEESDIEEVLPQDPLAMSNEKVEVKKAKPLNANSSTIVVKDTKRLVEIAAKSNSNNSGNKKEPTLVIIDTNSILSGRGPVPVNKSSSSSSSPSVTQSYPTLLPMALPAQGMYPPNMRATITPIPINSSAPPAAPTPSLVSKPPPSSHSSSSCINPAALAPVLPTLTDDMFVVEAPSFIVPYVYEKPPVTDFKEFLKDVADKIAKDKEQDKSKSDQKDAIKKAAAATANKDDKTEGNDVAEPTDKLKDEIMKDEDLLDPSKKSSYSYFDSPLGKFFIDIGLNLVQEFVQSDLLRQQKRKREREGGQNPTTNKTIHSLLKNLEFSKENNEPFKTPMKKCEFCNFKTESLLVMAHHLETPHTKNYVYKCNFCTYEARSPHDILFHMEAEHAVRGRLERAPSFHQCPNCPFEDNQKGKLSRHLVACMRKFKPEKNLDPPIDWEPPAKIPRVPKARQGINVSAYQAMKSSQLQFLSKMQLLNTNSSSHALHRGRGRPSLAPPIKQTMIRPSGAGLVYKQTMSGGSVLVPTNYQLSGNQVYQPQNQSKNKSVHQPSISITPLPRASASPNTNITSKPGDTNSKNSFVICEICDGYIKDLEQLRNHMQWIHKVKIHPKMIYNRPPLNCQKCQFRFFTDQGLERHLLGSHGLVTSSMQDAANKSKDAGRCPVCGRVYQWKLLNHVARDHNMTLKPAHLSYKCTVCTATFGMYKQFENHVYSAHSVVAKRVMDKKNSSSTNKTDAIMKPLKINDEITIIPQPAKSTTAGTSKEGSPSSTTGSTNSRNSTPSTSKNKKCRTPIVQDYDKLSSGSLESYIIVLLKGVLTENTEITLEEIVSKLLTRLDLFPDRATASSKTYIFLLCYIILNGTWIVSAVALLMGTCFGIKQALSLIFYGPWLVMTVIISLFDASASIAFGLDVPETINFSNWLKFVGIEDTSKFEDFDARNSSVFVPLALAPTIALCSISSRFVVIWLSNWFGVFYVFKAAVFAYRDSYKGQPHSARSRIDPNTSAARIRNWQLFYGAADTTTITSSHSSKSIRTERDLSLNKDKESEVESGRVSDTENLGNYFAYPDVADSINGNICLNELRGQLPWSYIRPLEAPRRRSSEETIEMGERNRRGLRLKSDSSASGTEM